MGYCTACKNFQWLVEPITHLEDHFGVERQGVCALSYDGSRVLLTGAVFGSGCKQFEAGPPSQGEEKP